jgi:hypothetical protein
MCTIKYYLEDQIVGDEEGGTRGTNTGYKKLYKILVRIT